MPLLESSKRVISGVPSPKSRRDELIDFHAHEGDPRWQLAQRIASSDGLSRSRLLQDFLLYIVDRDISERIDDITEQQIGVLVFGRREGYDSNEDNIVRSYARNLRKRVDEYFAAEGREEKLRLTIPRGGYRPTFFELGTPPLDKPSVDPPDELRLLPEPAPSVIQGRTFRLTSAILLALGLGILIGIGTSILVVMRKPIFSRSDALAHHLWSQLFSGDHDTFLVPSDDGLVIMQGLTPRPVPLADYVNGRYRVNADRNAVPGGERLFVLGGRRYTSVVDLDLIAHLAQLQEVVSERMMVRYARDLRMDDLRTGNAVLIGADESNPWIELFQQQIPFRFCFDCGPEKRQVIFNAHPQPGEKDIYVNSGDGDTYGLIAFLPNLNSTGHVLIIAGLNTAGTQAAASFLLDRKLMSPILQDAKTANGTIDSFEIVVSAGNVATNASTPHVVLERTSFAK
jgi:hypothetical protein